ncbi:hypothetical protein PHISCL_09008 [Aspergillus sclerotialis]|uniref:Uncharacterized protein n=1 Tax=Aspergillus sclerotialis TaxID=2070753 RepID=A0A3A2Z6C8_9EURO|nr:hypothetical protein PHISCL_09008 [Aspergillus sclerotialis]
MDSSSTERSSMDVAGQLNQYIDELLRPIQIDRAEDVEEELLSSQLAGQVGDLIHSNNVCRTNEDGYHQLDDQIDELLKPVQFDWADDVEEELLFHSRRQVDSSEDMSIDSPQSVDPSENFRVPDEGDMVEDIPISDASLGPMGETDENSEAGFSIGRALLSSIQETPYSGTMEGSSFDSGFAEAEFQVSREFVSRALMVNTAVDIHHFNWRGSPVYEYSSTPPAISLLYLLSDPKVPKQSDELRLQAILTRATTYIDPVLVSLDNGWDDLNTKGFELVQFATGRTSKFYTPHGAWIHDNNEKDDQTILDDGDICIYISPNMAAANGFVELCPIRSKSQWEADRDRRIAYANSPDGSRFLAKMKNRVYVPSPLKYSVAQEDLVAEVDADAPVPHEDKYEEEGSDKVGELPLILRPRKRTFSFEEEYDCSNKTLKRRQSLSGLRQDTQTDHYSLSGAGMKASYSNTPHMGSEMDSDHQEDGFKDNSEKMESVPLEKELKQRRPDRPSMVNASHSSDWEEGTIDFVPRQASDVPFVSVRPRRGRRYRAVLRHWKSKWKKRVDRQHRRRCAKAQPIGQMSAGGWSKSPQSFSNVRDPSHTSVSSCRSSFSSTSFSHVQSESTPVTSDDAMSEFDFIRQYFSFPTPVFNDVPKESDLSSIATGENTNTNKRHENKIISLVKRMTSKGRSLYNEVESRLHVSKDEAESRERFLMPKVIES